MMEPHHLLRRRVAVSRYSNLVPANSGTWTD